MHWAPLTIIVWPCACTVLPVCAAYRKLAFLSVMVIHAYIQIYRHTDANEMRSRISWLVPRRSAITCAQVYPCREGCLIRRGSWLTDLVCGMDASPGHTSSIAKEYIYTVNPAVSPSLIPRPSYEFQDSDFSCKTLKKARVWGYSPQQLTWCKSIWMLIPRALRDHSGLHITRHLSSSAFCMEQALHM